jgi:CDP-6-deoxy-D-xylo-4-hexulose-3-dehydrase
MIRLTDEIINRQDVAELIEWLQTYPRLTKGELTKQFEKEWSEYVDCKHSVFVNSGSSANLLMCHVYQQLSSSYKGAKMIVPALCWSTSIAPVMQMGYQPILCDVEMDTLCIDANRFEYLCKKHHPQFAMIVYCLGMGPTELDDIMEICRKYRIIVLEDACENMGSTRNGRHFGTYALEYGPWERESLGSYSYYWGHHLSTIEGGMVCTNSDTLYHLLLMSRSHGWSRDLPETTRKDLKKRYRINDFNELYTIYASAYNVRSTDLQAFLGLNQIQKAEEVAQKRAALFQAYQEGIQNDYWKPKPNQDIVSAFSYPIIHPKRDELAKRLQEMEVECRPLICGSIAKQPFYLERYENKEEVKNADLIHDYGMYVGCHTDMTTEDVESVCEIVNGVINED